MAKKKSSRSSGFGLSGIAFFAIMLIGLSLLTAFILGKIDTDTNNLDGIAGTLRNIGFALAIIVTAILSYNWARRSKQWVFVLWILAIIIVIVFYVLSLI